MNQNDQYLLTGATGFLGSIIYKALTSRGFTITNTNIDITTPFVLDNELRADIVIHAAGKAHFVAKTAKEEKIFYDVNFEGTKNLCSALENLPVKPKSFIFISTVAVYGLDSGNLVSEDQVLNGTSPYARSKIMAEEWVRNWAEENHVILGILRLPLVAGINPPGNLGDMLQAIRKKRYASIGKANARKSMVWAEDIPAIIPKLAEIGGVFHLTDGIHPDFKQLELTISKKNNYNLKTVPVPVARVLAFAGDMLGWNFPINSNKLKKILSTLTFDDTKARNKLGWKSSSVLEKLSEGV